MKNQESIYLNAILRSMLLSRACDYRNGLATRQGNAWFSISSSGHEVLACIGHELSAGDIIVPHYRDMALCLARGLSIEAIARNTMAKATDAALGRNMSAHFSASELGIFSVASPVASQCLPAVGMAWALKKQGKPNVVYCGIGDASTRQGEFYEAICFAVEKSLPIIFVVEDNGYGISTKTDGQNPFKLSIFSDLIYEQVSSKDVLNCFSKFQTTIERLRANSQPAIITLTCDRLESHTSSDDQTRYRPKTEINSLADPVELLKEYMINKKIITSEAFSHLKSECDDEVESAYDSVIKEPDFSVVSNMEHLYAESSVIPIDEVSYEKIADKNMVKSINRAFCEELENNENLILFGQDIEDPKGGVFGLTKGLSQNFPERVVNSPLAEATIIGVGVGLAAMGFKPVLELQFIDFVMSAMNQIMSQVATLRWRSGGNWTCPLVMYAPYGAFNPGGGIWHSQSNEGLLSHIPGIEVKVASDPYTIYRLFKEAFHFNNPTLILIPKHLMRKPDFQLPLFRKSLTNVVVQGRDITVVCWGNCVELAEAAAKKMRDDAILVDVVELVSLSPCDWASIKSSVELTGTLIVIQEDNTIASFGEAIINHIVTDTETFYNLKATPKLIARQNVHVPFNKLSEAEVLPNVAVLIKAIESILSEVKEYEYD